MSVPIWHVSAFARTPFAGNPAAVCLLEQERSADWLRAVAGQMNLSETAFLWPEGGEWRLRWFTPRVEVDLCGHATLASAHVLYETGRHPSTSAMRFRTRSGVLTVRPEGHRLSMDFPARPATAAPLPPGLSMLGEVRWSGQNGMDWLAELADETAVRSLAPDMALLAALPVRGLIVTARSARPEFDFVSRFFAPAVGVPEDPVTGSAHCCLGPHWSARLGKDDLRAAQLSERGGELGVRVAGERVHLSGSAVTVLRGELLA
ncbi:MAG: PhzF family phenazine biosynthesis protein [Gemmataceae bacterium]|nr:PhzF family phenazine biosynthesis protein [Gemmataceae bacterium]